MPQTPMTPPDLSLRDIHLPAEIGYWPLAPGWWLLLGGLILLGLGVLFVFRFRQRRRLRRLALRQLDSLQSLRGAELATDLSRLLRQAAVTHFPRYQVAGLTGRDWLEFLDRPFPERPFTTGVGSVLYDAPYRSEIVIEDESLISLCRKWLRKLPPQPLSFWRGR